MSDIPIQPLATPPASPPPTVGGKPSRLLITVIAISGVLLLTVVALVFLLLGRDLGDADTASDLSSLDPTPSITPSTTPSAEAEEPQEQPEEAPVDTSTRFTSFTAPTEVMCDAGDEDNQPPKPEIQVSWASANAVEAWYTPSNEDAKDDNYMQIPLSGDQSDLTDEHLFPCFHENELTLTITLVGPNGEHVSKQWTVTNVGDQ